MIALGKVLTTQRGNFTTVFDLSNYPISAVFFIGLAAIFVTCEIGWQVGVRNKGEGGSNIATLESAMLGLLALFEARRDALLNEANTIGTTALRARLLPDPYRSEILKLLKEYVEIRNKSSLASY